ERAGETNPLVLGEHFERGGDPARAITWYLRAAEEARESNDFSAAIARAERGIACGAAGEVLGALRLLEAESYRWRGDVGLAEDAALEATSLIEQGSEKWYVAVSEVAMTAGRRGHLDHVVRLAEELLVAPPPAGAEGPCW